MRERDTLNPTSTGEKRVLAGMDLGAWGGRGVHVHERKGFRRPYWDEQERGGPLQWGTQHPA